MEDSEERIGDGKNFRGAEAHFLAKKWISQSIKGPDQMHERIWDEIEDN